MSSSPLHIPLEPAAESAVPLKILTLNAHKGFTFFNRRMVLHELREAVREVSADLVFLQEVVGSNAHFSTRYPQWPEGSQYEFLADTIWSAYAYGRNAVYPQGHHGNALLSKYPIRYHANHDVSVGGPERRGLLHCVLDLPGSRDGLHAICVHLGLLESHRRQQLDLLCELIDREIPAHAPLIVAGDFNDWRLRAHDHLRRCVGLREAFVENCGAAARTFPARWPWLRLDRIYVRHLHVHHLAVLSLHPWSHLSDHAALLAEVRV